MVSSYYVRPKIHELSHILSHELLVRVDGVMIASTPSGEALFHERRHDTDSHCTRTETQRQRHRDTDTDTDTDTGTQSHTLTQ